MNWVVYILIFLALAIWIFIKKRQMSREEKELNKWLHYRGLIRHNKDPFGLISVFQNTEWIMNLYSIYQVIQIMHFTPFYFFNADKKTSGRLYRTYGCVLMKIPRRKALFLFSRSIGDLDRVKIEANLTSLENFDGKQLKNLFAIYADDTEDARKVLTLLEPILLKATSKDLIIEIRDENLLILRDEYFKFTDIEASLTLAKNIYDALSSLVPVK